MRVVDVYCVMCDCPLSLMYFLHSFLFPSFINKITAIFPHMHERDNKLKQEDKYSVRESYEAKMVLDAVPKAQTKWHS